MFSEVFAAINWQTYSWRWLSMYLVCQVSELLRSHSSPKVKWRWKTPNKWKYHVFFTDFFKAKKLLSVKPKPHFLIHYATQYKRFGHFFNNMTLRYETRHANMKSTVSTSKNYRNVFLSIALGHQFDPAYHHMIENYLPSDCQSFTKIGVASVLNNDEIQATKKCKNCSFLCH